MQIYFKKWRNQIASNEVMMMSMDQMNLESKIEDQVMAVKNKKKEIEAVRSGRVHAVAQSKSLSKKVIANYFVRMSNANLARGFYTWKDKMTDDTRKKRILGKFLKYWTKNQLFRGFRAWADAHNTAAKAELEEARR